LLFNEQKWKPMSILLLASYRNKTSFILQITGGKDEPNIVLMYVLALCIFAIDFTLACTSFINILVGFF
jgi:hypothetical protein